MENSEHPLATHRSQFAKIPLAARYSILTEQAVLALKVCDPASGSGHFLIAAAHRIARVLAAVRTGDDEPSPEATRHALRDVIGRCLYGVDINPMAVELCKVSLWMESLEPGKPLSFLNSHIKCGNSLVGVGPGLDISEIPDDAFQPAFGDDRKTATALRRRNKREREGQLGFRWDVTLIKDPQDLARWVARQSQKLEAMPEESAAQIREKEAAYQSLLTTDHFQSQRLEYDLWTAAFFWPIPEGDAETLLAPTQQELLRLRKDEDLDSELARRVRALAEEQRFFHWAFEFPTLFAGDDTGFDVTLGNPPWDMVEFDETEYFASRVPEISKAPSARKRQELINELQDVDPIAWSKFIDAKRAIYAYRNFVQKSNRFPRGAVGRINLYPLFVELDPIILNIQGQAGIIVPSAISMDAYNAKLFGWLVKNDFLESFFDFENRKGLFPSVDSRYRFCLLSLSKSGVSEETIDFCYYCHNVLDLNDAQKRYSLTVDQVKRFSPNTLAPPILLTKVDAELANKAYLKVGVLVNSSEDTNLWDISIQRMLSLSDKGDIFRRNDELVELEIKPAWVRLYSGKTIHQFNHRFSSWKYKSWKDVEEKDLENAHVEIRTEYYVQRKEVEKRTSEKKPNRWLIGYRDICRATDERTAIATIIPWIGCDTHCRNIYSNIEPINRIVLFVANFNSLIFDYFCRQKVISTGLGSGLLEQLPFVPPNIYNTQHTNFVNSRSIELIYTAWDLQPFAEDMGYDGPPFRWDEKRRSQMRAELDVLYAHLYGLNRKQLRYILDPADLTPAEMEDILDPWEEVADPLDVEGYTARVEASTFPGETFRVLKTKEIKKHGEYRTRRLVLEAWERLAAVNFDVEAYVPMTDPPPAHPSMAHPNRDGTPYTGPGLVIDFDAIEEQREEKRAERAVREPSASYAAQSQDDAAVESPAVEEASQPADYALYKCQGCGQMVVGFDREGHVKKVHGGESQEFVRL